jgi:hypothetical protein
VPTEVLGPWGELALIVSVISLVITGFAKGWLRPSTSVDRENKHLEGRMADKDAIITELKATNRYLMETNRIQATALRESAEIGRTSNAALASLPRAEVESP